MEVVETNVRRLTLSREILASFLPEGSQPWLPADRCDGRRPTTQSTTGASDSNDGSGTFCACC
jgi:hypothetical protein